MSLSRDTLFKGFMEVVEGCSSGSITVDIAQFPNMPDVVAQGFAKAYDEYVKDAVAGELTINARGDATTLQTNFEIPKLEGWASGIGIYWGGATFQGAGFVDNNQVTQASNTKMIGDMAQDINFWVNNTGPNAPNGPTQGTDRLVGILHSRTLELIIQRTTSDSSGTQDTVQIG